MDGRRHVELACDRLEIHDVEGEGEHVAVPSHDIEWMVRMGVHRVMVSRTDQHLSRRAITVDWKFSWRPDVALRIWGVLEELPVLVSISLGDLDRTEGNDGKHAY